MLKLIAIAFVLTVVSITPSTSQQYTQEQRQACEADAFRLCEHAIPDEAKVRACMAAKYRRLSPACRRVFQRKR